MREQDRTDEQNQETTNKDQSPVYQVCFGGSMVGLGIWCICDSMIAAQEAAREAHQQYGCIMTVVRPDGSYVTVGH